MTEPTPTGNDPMANAFAEIRTAIERSGQAGTPLYRVDLSRPELKDLIPDIEALQGQFSTLRRLESGESAVKLREGSFTDALDWYDNAGTLFANPDDLQRHRELVGSALLRGTRWSADSSENSAVDMATTGENNLFRGILDALTKLAGPEGNNAPPSTLSAAMVVPPDGGAAGVIVDGAPPPSLTAAMTVPPSTGPADGAAPLNLTQGVSPAFGAAFDDFGGEIVPHLAGFAQSPNGDLGSPLFSDIGMSLDDPMALSVPEPTSTVTAKLSPRPAKPSTKKYNGYPELYLPDLAVPGNLNPLADDTAEPTNWVPILGDIKTPLETSAAGVTNFVRDTYRRLFGASFETLPVVIPPSLNGARKWSASQLAEAEAAFQFWLSKGLTEEQSAGLVANESAESAFVPTASGDPAEKTGIDLARGLFQWHPNRRQAMHEGFGTKIDIAEEPAEIQRQAAWWELNHPESRAFDALKNTKTAYDAGYVVSKLYERPKLIEEDATARGLQAEMWLNYFHQKGPLPPIPGQVANTAIRNANPERPAPVIPPYRPAKAQPPTPDNPPIAPPGTPLPNPPRPPSAAGSRHVSFAPLEVIHRTETGHVIARQSLPVQPITDPLPWGVA